MTLIDQLLAVANAYCLATNTGRGTLSARLLGKGSQLQRIADGKADLTTKVFERFMAALSQEWPDKTPWPEGVTRPLIETHIPPSPATPVAAGEEGEAAHG